ncbi:MAG: hypothetical protein ABIO36_04565 [Pyrinomonadaceae bacterium]
MSNKAVSADLLMKLYDLRRESTMREARNWFVSFFPESLDDIMRTVIDESTSAKYRMVTSYWDMAAGFVNRGAIDETMFMDSSGEAWIVFSKIQPYLAEFRESVGAPTAMKHLEDLLMRQPNALEFLEFRREGMKRWMEKRNASENAAQL